MNLKSAKSHPNKEIVTIGLILAGDEILLAMKKRGFGAGWWNGYGGKLKVGETIEEGLRREFEEESTMIPQNIEKMGTIWFEFEGDSKLHEGHIFQVLTWGGVPTETEEMRPEWFYKARFLMKRCGQEMING